MDYGISEQAERLFRLLDALQVERAHVAGNSMGGAIAIEMARRQPDRLRSLGLVDAAGITLQTPEFLNVLEQSDSNPLIPHSAEDFRTTLDWASERSVGIPDFAITLMGVGLTLAPAAISAIPPFSRLVEDVEEPQPTEAAAPPAKKKATKGKRAAE